jgi:hypothetical protein
VETYQAIGKVKVRLSSALHHHGVRAWRNKGRWGGNVALESTVSAPAWRNQPSGAELTVNRRAMATKSRGNRAPDYCAEKTWPDQRAVGWCAILEFWNWQVSIHVGH